MISAATRTLFLSWGLALAGCGSDTSLLDESAPTSGGSPGSAGLAAQAGRPSATAGATGGGASAGSSGAAMSPGGSANGGAVATTAGSGSGGSSTKPRTRQKLEPEDGKTLLFIGQDTSEVESYAGALGMPGGVMLYSNVWDGLGVLSASDFGGYGTSDLGHWGGRSEQFALQVGLDLDHGENCGTCAGCSRVGYLEQLATGAAERVAKVRSVIQALRDSGRPVLLRVGYEFDAEICPGGFGKYPMAAYQQAFQRVHQLVAEEHADRVALVWASWAFQARDPAKAVGVSPWGWYPGDDVVDWIGLSVFPGYSAATDQSQADKRRQVVEFAKQHGKPMMVAESTPRARFAPQGGATAWDGWYAGVFDYIEQSDIKAFSYINMNWEALGMWRGQGWGDTRVQGSPIDANWRTALQGSRFVSAHSGLYQELGL